MQSRRRRMTRSGQLKMKNEAIVRQGQQVRAEGRGDVLVGIARSKRVEG